MRKWKTAVAECPMVSCGASDADTADCSPPERSYVTDDELTSRNRSQVSESVDGEECSASSAPVSLSTFTVDGSVSTTCVDASTKEEAVERRASAGVTSKKPLKCPHGRCGRTVAISAFISHFRHEHADVPKFSIGRRKDLVLPFTVRSICTNSSVCLALITVYEVNEVDLARSRSTRSVIDACSRFCGATPVNTFLLMVSGSRRRPRRRSACYAAVWMLANSDDRHRCTLDVSSAWCRTSCSARCDVNTTRDSLDVAGVVGGLRCLLLTRGALVSLLHEGPDMHLTVCVH